MKLFERIHQDTEIRQIYDAIGQMEDEEELGGHTIIGFM